MHIKTAVIISGMTIFACLSFMSYSEINKPNQEAKLETNENKGTISTSARLHIDVEHDNQFHHITLSHVDHKKSQILVIELGRFLNLDCNKHSLQAKLEKTEDTATRTLHYKLSQVVRGPSTMRACFDKALTQRFLAIPETIKVKLTGKMKVRFTIPNGTQIRYRSLNDNGQFVYKPEQSQSFE